MIKVSFNGHNYDCLMAFDKNEEHILTIVAPVSAKYDVYDGENRIRVIEDNNLKNIETSYPYCRLKETDDYDENYDKLTFSYAPAS